MKKVILQLCLVYAFFLTLLFFILNFSFSSFTGHAVGNATEATFSDAQQALQDAEVIMQEMQEQGFSIVFVNDTFLEAQRLFRIAKFAEILRNPDASPAEKSNARDSLGLVDWRNITYANVLASVEIIRQRREQAFLISDELTALRKTIDSEQENLNVTKADILWNEANDSFTFERYEEAQTLLAQSKDSLESEKFATARLTLLREQAKNFIEKYWYWILLVILVIGLIALFIQKRLRIHFLQQKIIKMKAEEKALVDLMKKSQEERFVKKTLSAIVYALRIDKYEKRRAEIKEQIPVLENRLKKLSPWAHASLPSSQQSNRFI